MVTVKVYKDRKDGYTSFSLCGHAGYAASGSDIVCAAVSVLVINTINSIKAFTQDTPSVRMEEAEGIVECRFLKKASKEAALLLDSMLLGLSGIEKEYGRKYIRCEVLPTLDKK